MRLLIGLLVLVLPAIAAAQAVLDVAAVPYLSPATRTSYGDFLISRLPRAFAVAPTGQIGWSAGGTLQAAREKALASCATKGGTACEIYAEDLQIVWHKHPPEPLPTPPGPLVAGDGWELVPDARYFWHGPSAARGVYVFGHGKNENNRDARGFQPHSYVRMFNNNGFDVVRFDRAPSSDYGDRANDWLHDGLRRMRALGYRMVIVGGQSRGAWNSLSVLDTPALADVVIAVSAAATGEDAARQAGRGQAEFYHMFSSAKSPTARVAIVQFADDPFEHNPAERFRMADTLLRPRVAALLKIDQPPGIKGHNGGYEQAFGERFALCLYRFATAATPPDSC